MSGRPWGATCDRAGPGAAATATAVNTASVRDARNRAAGVPGRRLLGLGASIMASVSQYRSPDGAKSGSAAPSCAAVPLAVPAFRFAPCGLRLLRLLPRVAANGGQPNRDHDPALRVYFTNPPNAAAAGHGRRGRLRRR